MMKKFVLANLCVVSMVAASGCGKNLAPLTADQKSVVQDTMQGVGRGYHSAKSKQTNSIPTTGVTTSGQATSVSQSQDQNLFAMEQKMGNCKYDGSGMGSSSPFAAGGLPSSNLSFSLSGDQCPISASFSGTVSASSQTSGSVKLTLDYAVNDATFRSLNDMDSLHLEGTVAVDVNTSSSSGHVNADLRGKLHSQKRGDVGFNILADQAIADGAASGSREIDLVFKDFEADLKVTGDSKNPKYFINSELVTQDEFAKYVQGLIQ